ncbi:MAG: UDP-N-acetylmuramate dehydrogenase [Sphingobacteriales bacterium]|nr:MAG: UDP-N-acetylmuramate dehydrogenase [Sphingobacteriales bacterium]TAF78892.1 MAG: UDP-N-acetylmuramate dehydrogenase [Sphingobacteriales bacterium]
MLHIQNNVSLKSYNSFGIDAKAAYFVEINHESELNELFKSLNDEHHPILVMGGGSNMLFTKNYQGLVIKINLKGIAYSIDNKTVKLTAAAGEVWNDVVKYAVAKGFGGLENLTLIPGLVGASPIQNIGAYGTEIKDIFESCTAFEIKTGNILSFFKADCVFAYRESIFKNALKGQYIITSVTFNLSINTEVNTHYGAILHELQQRNIQQPTINDVSDVVAHIRVSKLPDPSTIGNAGSFFKNPIVAKSVSNKLLLNYPDLVFFDVGNNATKLAAGWLIEQCGWKGKVIGNTGTWKNQALVLVNYGAASGQEVYDFSVQIIQSVKDKFGVELEREVNVF